ncbi:MAG: toxin-antitoxin system HicB family antitoxin [Alphaproteobacteria bacterium]|nr:toxin-antitoxin system HicB family antitoxin [Alphaproteobacteria bacterium]
MKPMSVYPLRLPRSIKAAVQKIAAEEGVSLNQFVATAVAEKLSAMRTAAYFEERRSRSDFAAFRRLLKRRGGEAPRADDR